MPLLHQLPVSLPDHFLVPGRIELEGDDLVWEWCGREPREGWDTVLKDFTRLAGGKGGQVADHAILAFAQRYGPLRGGGWTVEQKVNREPLSKWRQFARQVQVIANVTKKLLEGEKASREDWRPLAEKKKDGFARALQRQVLILPGESPVPLLRYRRGTRQEQVELIQAHVTALLFVDEARLRFVWEEGEQPKLLLESRGFLGPVAFQLAGAAMDGSIAVCHHCGAVFRPARKRPAGQRSFCRQHRGKRSMYAMREHRARQRGGIGLQEVK